MTTSAPTATTLPATPTHGADRPLRADAERNRRRILDAAREVFARRGLEAGLDEIARHAGVGTGTVYRRFPDKARLVEALFEERLALVLGTISDAADEPDAWQGFVGAIEALTRMQIEDRGLKDVFFSHFGDAEAFREHHDRLVPLLESLVSRAKAAGELRPDVELTDLAVVQLTLCQVGRFAEDVEPDLWRRHLGIVLDGLRVARSAPSPLGAPPMDAAAFDAACGRERGGS
ncbi:MAG: TetR/AcrR family transcriptional regulator [Pseudonocardia sp.]|nr:TetR/AcrR family transcriptional regulator [Pseudonocardia sp.]